MDDSRFNRLYASVPVEQREALREFRRTHPPRHAQIDGVEWEYLVGGQGAQTILILVGGLRVADAAFRSILRLEPDFRVITPTYPALDTMSGLAAGVVGVLAAEGITQVHVLSGSFGGMLAISLVQHHPAQIGKLILSSTAIPGAAAAKSYQQMDRLVSLMPSSLARRFMKRRLLQIVDPPAAEYAFWKAYMDELFGFRLSKADIQSTLRCIVDFANTAPRSMSELAGWTGDTLLITSDDDHTFDKTAQQALGEVVPRTHVHTLHGAGHSPAMTQPDEFFGAVREFLG